MISASHNPFADNGVKLFAPGGRKLADEVEARIEARLAELRSRPAGAVDPTAPTGDGVGVLDATAPRTPRTCDLASTTSLDGRRLAGLQVVLDCANGAASRGRRPSVLGAARRRRSTCSTHRPDGRNINDGCGSTAPRRPAAGRASRSGADVGLGVRRRRRPRDRGRRARAPRRRRPAARDLRPRPARAGALAGDAVVVTVMSNLGLRRALEPHGIDVVETPVGDRNVLEALERGGYVARRRAVRARHLPRPGHHRRRPARRPAAARHVGAPGRPLSELARGMTSRFRRCCATSPWPSAPPDVTERLAAGDRGRRGRGSATTGRVLVRPSGTEPLVRVMVEATDAAVADGVAGELAAAVERADRFLTGPARHRSRGVSACSRTGRPSPDDVVPGSRRSGSLAGFDMTEGPPMCGIIAVVRQRSQRSVPDSFRAARGGRARRSRCWPASRPTAPRPRSMRSARGRAIEPVDRLLRGGPGRAGAARRPRSSSRRSTPTAAAMSASDRSSSTRASTHGDGAWGRRDDSRRSTRR